MMGEIAKTQIPDQKRFKCAGNSLHLKCKSNCFFSLTSENSDTSQLQRFQHGRLDLAYAVWGHGNRIVLAFHGFSLDHRVPLNFLKNWPDDLFTTYSFDLPFHGASQLPSEDVDRNPLTQEEFTSYFEAFIQSIGVEKVAVLGYSLGGRIAMKIGEVLPERVEHIYLFAPDGLTKNRWYVMLSHKKTGRSAFRYFIKNNRHFEYLLGAMHRARIVNHKTVQFVKANTETTELQWQVYNVWAFLRLLDPRWKEFVRTINENRIPIDLFLGERDRVIPVKNGDKLKRDCPHAKIHILESGHVLLTKESARVIREKGWM